MRVIQFDGAESQTFHFYDPAGTVWPDLASDTPVALRVEVRGVAIQAAGTVVVGTGANKHISVTLSRAASGALPACTDDEDAGIRPYQLLRTPDADTEWLLDEGVVTVDRKIPAPAA